MGEAGDPMGGSAIPFGGSAKGGSADPMCCSHLRRR